MFKKWISKAALLALAVSSGLMVAGCPMDSSRVGGDMDPLNAAWKQVSDVVAQAESSDPQEIGDQLEALIQADIAATDVAVASDNGEAVDDCGMVEPEATWTIENEETVADGDDFVKLADQASEFEVAELLAPGYHYIRARIIDRTRGATSGLLRAYRQAPNFVDRSGTLQANQGFRVITSHSAPGVVVNLRLTYRGQTLTKRAVGGLPPNPTNIVFEYVNGRLR